MANTAGNLGTTWGWGLGENNWKATHDKNLRAFDALVQCHIIERVLTTPPATPADGDCYIPATGATGAWAGHVDEIARWNGVSSQWEFWVPRKGWEVFNESDNYAYRWSGTAWAGCNFSFTQLDQNYIKRSGETTTINTTGGFSTSGVTRITAAGVGQFTGLTSSGGGTISGGKFTVAAAAAGYASFRIIIGTDPTSPVDGDMWANTFHVAVKGLGLRSARGANDTVGLGSYLQLTDLPTAETKGWTAQLGVNNTLDFWNYSSGWIRKARMTSTGSIGRAQSSDVTAATTQTKTITLPAEDGLFELSLVATVNNANAYGIRAMRVGLVSYSAYPYTAFGAVVNVISDQSQFLTGPAPTVSVTSAANGVITITVTGTGTKKLDTNLIKVCDSQPI